MKKALITQRYEKIGIHQEKRDNVDVRLSKIIEKIGYFPFFLPNELNLNNYIKKINPDAIILSGGGNPNKKDLRQKNEINLLKYSLKKKIPILGICRGAQQINLFCKGKLIKLKNHVRKKNKLAGPIVKNKIIKVNCYHDFGIVKKNLGNNLKILATSKDGSIECFEHKKNKWLGIMWHPERNKIFSRFDISLIKKII